MKDNKTIDWSLYYTNRKEGPRPEVVYAVRYVKDKNYALDLGCGNFHETFYLLEKGFNVVAVDPEKALLKRALLLPLDQAEFDCVKIEEFSFPKDCFDFVCANYSLPWVPKQALLSVFKKIKSSINEGGVFCFQLFGVNDDWNVKKSNGISFYNESDVLSFIKDFKIINFQEIEKDKKSVSGRKKHWHVYSVIVKK